MHTKNVKRLLKRSLKTTIKKTTVSMLVFTFLFGQTGVPLVLAAEGSDYIQRELFKVQTMVEVPLPIYAQPNATASVAGVMESDVIVDVKEVSQEGDWYYIESEGVNGWVQGKFTEIIGDEDDARINDQKSATAVAGGSEDGMIGKGGKNLPLYQAQDRESEVKAAIPADVEFTIQEVSSDSQWYQAYYYEHSGWIFAQDVIIVDGNMQETETENENEQAQEDFIDEDEIDSSELEADNAIEIADEDTTDNSVDSDVSTDIDDTNELAQEGLSGEVFIGEGLDGIAVTVTERDIPGKIDGEEIAIEEAMQAVVEATTPIEDSSDTSTQKQEIITVLEGQDFEDVFSISLTNTDGELVALTQDDFTFVAGSVILVVEPIINLDPDTYTLTVSVTNPVTGITETITQNFKWGVLAMNADKDVYGVGDVATVDFSVLDEGGVPVCLYEDTENENNLSFQVTAPDGTQSEYNTLNQTIGTSATCDDLSNDVDADYTASVGFDQAGIYTFELDALTSNGRYSDVVFTTLTQAVEVGGADENPGTVITRDMNTRLFPNEDADVEISVTFADDYKGEIYDVTPKAFEISNISDDGETDDVDGGSEFQAVKWDIDVEAGDTETFTYTYNAPDVSPAFYTVGPFQSEDGSVLEGRVWEISSDALPAPGGVDTDLQLWLKADADAANTGEGTDVTAWTDQVDSNNIFADTATSTGEPNYLGTGLNFNPSLEFAGTDYLEIEGDAFTGDFSTGGFDVFYVTEAPVVTSYDTALYLGSDQPQLDGRGLNFAQVESDRGALLGLQDTSDQHDLTEWDATNTNASAHIWNVTDADKNNVHTTSIFYADGGSVAGNNILGDTTWDGNTVNAIVGNSKRNSGADCSGCRFNGEIAEIIAYSNENGPIERQKIQSYLALKYGITLDQSDAAGGINYTNSAGTIFWTQDTTDTYEHDIFGLGEDTDTTLDQRVSKSSSVNAILTIATDDDFITPNNNTRTAVGDGNFIVVSNDNGAANWSTTGAPTDFEILEKTWKVEETGTVGSVYLEFDAADAEFNLPAAPEYPHHYIVIDSNNDQDFSDETPIQMTNNSGDLWSTAVDFSDGERFTLALSTIPVAHPGGIATDLSLWLKSDAGTGTTTEGASVSTWRDYSDLTIPVAGVGAPTYSNTATNQFNHNPILDFSGGAADILVSKSTPFAGNTNQFNVFSVQKHGSGEGGVFLGPGTVTPVGPAWMEYNETIFFRSGFSTNNAFEGVVAIDDNVPHITMLRRNGSFNFKFLVDGVLDTSRTISSGFTGTPSYRIGSNGGLDPYGGHLAEVIVYSGGSLDGTQEQQVQSYLALKYGITLKQGSMDYLASDSAVKMWDATAGSGHANDIAGVGRDDAQALGQVQSKSISTDAIVSLSAELEGTNGTNTFTDLDDLEFFTFGNNNGGDGSVPAWTKTNAPAGYTILERAWSVQENNGDTGSMQLDFDVANGVFDVPDLVSGTGYYFLYDLDNDGDLSDETIVGGGLVPMADQGGDIWRVAGINFTSGQEFTIASENGYTVSGVVYYDESGEGTKDAGETARLQDVTVTLYNDVDTNGKFSPGDTVYGTPQSSTATNGEYEYTEVLPGTYVIKVDQADTALNGLAANGSRTYGVTSLAEIALTLSAHALDQDFGFDEVEVAFAGATSAYAEAASSESIGVTQSLATAFETTIPYLIGAASTASTADYTDTSANTLSIAAGSTSGNILLDILADVIVEGDENIIYTLGVPTNAANAATNQGHTATITDDDVEATLTAVSIASDNADPTLATTGDIVTVSFTSDVAMQNVAVEIAGQTAAVSGGPTDWTATYVTQSTDAETVVPFTIDGESFTGTPLTQVIGVTDATSVTVDTTPPADPTVTSVDGDTTDPYLTNDKTPDVILTVDNGTTVSSPGWSCTPDPVVDNTATCTPDTDLVEGTTPVTFTSTDPAGNPSDTGSVDIEVDVTDPTNPVVVSVGGDTTDPYLTGSTQPPVILTVDNGTTVSAPGWTCAPDPVVGNTATCTPDADLAEGNNDVTFTSIEPSGNVSDSGIIAIEVDTSLPIAPTITSVDGDTTAPFITNDKTPDVILTVDNGTTVSAPGWTCAPDPVVGNTATCTPDADLTEGTTPVTFTSTDPAGNPSDTGSVDIEVDVTDPTTPVIDSVDGDTTAPFITNDKTPDVILTVDNGTTVSAPGWTCAPDPVVGNTATCTPDADLTEGTTPVTFTSTDPAGNPSDTGSVDIEVDVTDPTTPVIDSVDGDTTAPFITNDKTPDVILTVDNGTTVSAPGWTCAPDPVVGNTATCTPDADLTEGTTPVTFTSTDPAGNPSDTGSVDIEVDVTDPTTPVIDSVDGDTTAPFITNDKTPDVILTVDNGTTVSAPGWTCAPDPVVGNTATCTPDADLTEGTTPVTFTSTDPAGNPSDTGSVDIEVDVTDPTTPVIDSVDGDTTAPFITNDKTPDVILTVDNGTTVSAPGWTCAPDPVVGNTATCTPDADLTEGTTPVTFTSTDPAGNPSDTGSVDIEVDVTDPTTPVIDSVDGDTTAPFITNDKTPDVILTVDNGTTVSAPGWTCAPDPVVGNTATCTPDADLTEGTTPVTFTAADPAGNIADAGLITIEVDTLPPPTPQIPDLQAISDSGSSDEDDYTSSNTLLLTLMCSAAGSDINVFNDNPPPVASIGIHPCATAGNETFTTPFLAAGTHNISLIETDRAGNISPEGLPLIVEIDNAAPTGGTENVTGPIGAISDTNTPITGSCGTDTANGTVKVITLPVNGFVNNYDTDIALDANGNFILSSPGWQEGSYEMLLSCSDQAGNGPVAAGPFGPVAIDSEPPVGPGTFDGPLVPTNDLDEDITGSCGADAANGSVQITTSPTNGFSNQYDVSITLDANGGFVLADPSWQDGIYYMNYACKDAAENGPAEMGPFGPVYIDTNPPAGPGKIDSPEGITNSANVAINGSCGPDSGNGTVAVTTIPANGFENLYDVEISVDILGNFTIERPFWNAGVYQVALSCKDWAGNGPSELGPFDSITIDTDAPNADEIQLTSPAPFPTETSSLKEAIVGTCGIEAANGTVRVTTMPENGFNSHIYGEQVQLDANGEFSLQGLEWTTGYYNIFVKCHDAIGNGPTTKQFGSYGAGQKITRDLHRQKDVEAQCLANGSVYITWHDDAKGENRQVIQRREGDNPWETIKKLDRSKESWTDKNPPKEAEYRLRAEAGDEVTKWSDKVTCTIGEVSAQSQAPTVESLISSTKISKAVGVNENANTEIGAEKIGEVLGTGGPDKEILFGAEIESNEEVVLAVEKEEKEQKSLVECAALPLAIWIIGLLIFIAAAFFARSWVSSGILASCGLLLWWSNDGCMSNWWVPILGVLGIVLVAVINFLRSDGEFQSGIIATLQRKGGSEKKSDTGKSTSRKATAKKMASKRNVKKI